MNCKKIQELMLTDYIDAEMGIKPKSLIDQHLAYCHVCNNFLINVKDAVINPINSATRAVPDEYLWAQIKETIEKEQQQRLERILIPNFWEKLRSTIHIPRPAFALATIVTMIFMVGTTGQLFINSQMGKVNGQDQMEYLSSLVDEPVDLAANDGKDSQTPIEKYFL